MPIMHRNILMSTLRRDADGTLEKPVMHAFWSVCGCSLRITCSSCFAMSFANNLTPNDAHNVSDLLFQLHVQGAQLM